jgi:DNA-binding transcriptional regulator/RsmH inhibitor MraZ
MKSWVSGKYYGKIENDRILLPRPFFHWLPSKQVHLLALSSGYLKLIPAKSDVWKKIENEIKELQKEELDAQVSYLGIKKATKNGYFAISKKVRGLAGLTTEDVVILGMLDSIEIWDRKKWDKNVEDFKKDPIKEIERGLAKYGLIEEKNDGTL